MIVVVCPAATVTGGPEALHQLVDSLTRQGVDAAMLYLPGDYHTVPDPYQCYKVRTVSENDIYPTDVVVIPEVMVGEVRRFAYARPIMWWLSVDNAAGGALTACGDHMAQSFYAWRHLRDHGHHPMMLGDYIHPVFAKTNTVREPWVAVNPAKGADLIHRFGQLCPDIEVRPIEGMNRDEVAGFLNRATVFVDFGHQPGKDRLPREASASGCVVFIRDIGAARFRQDYPLPDDAFFVGDDASLLALGERVRAVLKDSPPSFGAQVLYRRAIAREQKLFDIQAGLLASRFN